MVQGDRMDGVSCDAAIVPNMFFTLTHDHGYFQYIMV